MPALSVELEAILAERPPDDPAHDELWREVCRVLVRDLALELN
jgi:hypothetical protein